MRRRLACAVRDELDARKRRMAVMTYDDLLTRLDDTLKGAGGDAAAKRLRERYRVVLVDEFQDTDPVQWDIMRRAFGDGRRTLVLIGDPKQAIYAFRGADVYAYLEAATAGRHAGDARHQLAQRPGADRRLRRAASAARSSATRASSTARSAPPTPTRRRGSAGAPVAAPLRIRVVHRDDAVADPHARRQRQQRLRARARRQRPRRRSRRRCSPRTRRSRSAIRTASANAASTVRPATSPCSSARTATPR